MQRKNKFVLEDADDDDDEPTELLTHGGSALSTFDDFKDNISIEDDDDDAGCMVSISMFSFATSVFVPNFLYQLVYVFVKKLTLLLRDCSWEVDCVDVVGCSERRHCEGPAFWWRVCWEDRWWRWRRRRRKGGPTSF